MALWLAGWAVVASLATPAGDEMSRDKAVDLARQALAERLEVEPAGLELVEAEAVDWPDASLGCPEPDAMYAQMIVPGYKVRLKADGREYDVHVGGNRAVVCERPRPPRPGALAGPIVRLPAKARRDLARRLGVPEEDVEVKRVQPATWPDAGLGCGPAPDGSPSGEVKGYSIELASAGRAYHYHADQRRVVYCPEKGSAGE